MARIPKVAAIASPLVMLCASCSNQQLSTTTPTVRNDPRLSSTEYWEYARLIVDSDSTRLSEDYFEKVFTRLGERGLCVRVTLRALNEVSLQAEPPAEVHLQEVIAELQAFVDGAAPLSAVTSDFHRRWPEVLGRIQAAAESTASPEDMFLVRTRGNSVSSLCSATQELIDLARRDGSTLDAESTERLAWVACKLAESIGEREIVTLWSAENRLRDETVSRPLWATCMRYGSLFVSWRLDALAAHEND